MTALTYTDHDGTTQTVEGCNLTQDNAGRYWLWCEPLEHNLAYKTRSKDDCLIAAIDSLLFTIELKNERITALQKIADLAYSFASQINPESD